MQLRFGDVPLRPRFDLEMVGEGTMVAKAMFELPEGRKFSLSQGGWFEGSPGWHIDTTEGIARSLDDKVSPAALRRLLRSPTIAEPAKDLISIITDALPRVALEVGAALPDLSQVADVVDLQPDFRMRATGNLLEAYVSLRAAYGDLEVEVRADGISPPVIIQPPEAGEKRALCVRTDIVAQQEAARLLLDLGLQQNDTGESFIAKGDSAIRFWSEGVGSLPESWDLYVPEELVGTHVRNKPITMSARVSSGVDWLALKISYESEGIGVERSELERCLREGKKYVRLSDNSFAPLDATRMQALVDREIELIAAAGKTGKLPLSHAGRVQELLEQADHAVVAAGTKSLFKKLESIDEIKKVKKPRNLKATLRPYQEQGLSWLRFIDEIGSGGVLADDMGLGKTVQTIALLLSIKQDQKSLSALIVAPTSVVGNWVREISRFGPSLTTALWHGAGRKDQQDELKSANVIITSYALLRRDIDLLKQLDLDYAILDEAQNIKNPESATAAAARELNTRKRLALTGTPIENRLSEIWSIFEFVSPGLLGPLRKFEERFARPIDQGDSKTAARLRAVIHPFILRRTKMEVAEDLPPKIESDKIIDLAGDQKALYLQVLREVRAQVMGEVERSGLAKSQLHILAGLTKLRQAACDPRLLGLPRPYGHDDSAKLMALRELVEEAESGGQQGADLQSVRQHAEVDSRSAQRRQDPLRVSRRVDQRSRRLHRSLPDRSHRNGVPHQLKGGRQRSQPNGSGHGNPLRSLVEPSRRRASVRSCAPHRSKERGNCVSVGSCRHDRREDPRAQTKARPRRLRIERRRGRRQEAQQSRLGRALPTRLSPADAAHHPRRAPLSSPDVVHRTAHSVRPRVALPTPST